jgi:hypothetical protein
MYDMYPWDSASQGDYPPSPLRSRRNPARRNPAARHPAREAATAPREAATAPRETFPARAVQVALDRRDNGGRDNAGRDNGGRDNGGRDNGGDAAGEPIADPTRQ